ncbi:MAG: L,D-transpeptidase [Solirubrobacteraceae bacterium]|jgi:lipoprotein-anchoring transpeptidase ErfK/SrfK
MGRVRLRSRQLPVIIAAPIASALAAALVFSHAVPASTATGGLTAPPPAFAGDRPAPLTDPVGVTRWAAVLRATVARRTPASDGKAVGWVPARTSDGTANIVPAAGEVDRDGAMWVRVPLTALPNGAQGWVRRSALGGWSFVDTRLAIDRARLTATLWQGGRVVFRAPIGVGAPRTPTPAGTFYVRDRLNGFSNPEYGPLAFGTNARSPTLTDWPGGGIVGIHGTNRPDLIPGRVSHGCIRLTNAAILRLGQLMPIGTPVVIT